MPEPKGPKPRKIPMRMCVGCRVMKPKKELVRVVKSPLGAVSLDRIGKMPGRGAYVCRDTACLARAQKQRQLERALDAAIDESVYDSLKRTLAEAMAETTTGSRADVKDSAGTGAKAQAVTSAKVQAGTKTGANANARI
ncbi:hypothetical protein FACS1894184_07580 [Clostridia bacterium]|nr:hypothetical protein FACS1894184_07580 [Clostridia bacterium]